MFQECYSSIISQEPGNGQATGVVIKATKALKRLAKIETSLSDLIERYAAKEHRGQEFLQNAKASVIRARETLQASSRTAKNPHVKHGDEPPVKATSEPSKPKRRLSAAGKAAIVAALKKRWALKRGEAAKPKSALAKKGTPKAVKKAAVKAAPAKAAKKSAPVSVVKTATAQETAPAAAQTVAQATAQ
jgi:hypothetical protein